jgi:AcrR family transcriptional regulator
MLPSMTALITGRRVTADDWIQAGFNVLAEGGPNALRIGRLCDRLDVTKGSFYWHFTDMRAYRAALAPGATCRTSADACSTTCAAPTCAPGWRR